jgi:hypothetical protein
VPLLDASERTPGSSEDQPDALRSTEPDRVEKRVEE